MSSSKNFDDASPAKQLASFIQKFTPEIAALAKAVLAKMRTRYPTAVELVYDNYNALAIGFGPTERASEAIFSIAVFPKWISLFFLQAQKASTPLPDPEKRLQGSGNVVKHIRLASAATLDEPPSAPSCRKPQPEQSSRSTHATNTASSSSRFQRNNVHAVLSDVTDSVSRSITAATDN